MHVAFDSDIFCVIPESPVLNASDSSLIKLPTMDYFQHDDELEPTPIHPEFSHSPSCVMGQLRSQSPLTTAPSLVSGCVKRPLMAVSPAASCCDESSTVAPPPAKRARRMRVVHNEDDRAPRFRNYQEKQWCELYDILLEFKEAKGHCLVPHSYPENPQLSRWVKRQRYQYKLKSENMVSTMTDTRIQMLESIGFVWDSHAVAWEEHRLELVEFHATFGHCDVPSSYENSSLATWIKRQRRAKKLFFNGQKSTMTMERFALLEKLGFSWELKSHQNSNSKKSKR